MLIPLKVDVPTWRRPWGNYALICLIVCVSVAGFYNEELFLKLAGIRIHSLGTLLDPHHAVELTTEDFPLPVLALTSSLLHGGWLHLIGNMLFLWVFGNAINYKFGHLGYLVLYALAAMAGGLAHYAVISTPGVGASGAINGVMGAFLVFFPRNDVTVLWVIFIWRLPWVGRISSACLILFYVAWDVLYLALGVQTNIGVWAHVTGFLAGFLVALVCASGRWIKPTPDEQTLLQVFRRR